MNGQRVLAGIALVVLSTALFASLDGTSKFLVVNGVPALMGIWARYQVQAAITTAVVLPLHGWRALRTTRPLLQVLRGLLLFGCSAFMFASLRFVSLGDLTAIVLSTPLVITLLAALWLHEKVTPLRWLLVIGGFVGTLVILRPGSTHWTWAMMLPLCLVACNSAFQVLTGHLARAENPLTTHLYTGWTGTLIAALALPFVWRSDLPTSVWLAMGLAGLLAAVAHLLLILGYQRAPAMTLTPYLYAQIAFAVLGDWLVFSHQPDGLSAMGMGLIALCGAGGAWATVHETRTAARALQAARAAQVPAATARYEQP